MYSLIISLLAIALQAAALFCLVNYAPAWVKTAPDFSRVVAAGLSAFEGAFYRYGATNGGALPEPTLEPDGGLAQFQSPERHLAFLPKAPEGFAWKYGHAADYYVCLQAADAAKPVPEGLYYGVKRLRKLLPADQLVVSEGANSCGSTADVTNGPVKLPAPLSITYFLRYAPGQLPSTAVLPCTASGCLAADAL
jgi:hypothetical protein